MIKKIYVYLFHGFSDWEIAYLTPEINKSDKFELVYFSDTDATVVSMGGLHVHPQTTIDKISIDKMNLLILPGGEAWENNNPKSIDNIIVKMNDQQMPIAAICAATTELGKLGILDDIRHTSNDLEYLKAIAPNYKGEGNYHYNSLAISDQHVITANGIAPIEFAKEVFKHIKLYDDQTLEKWYQLFKNGIWEETE